LQDILITCQLFAGIWHNKFLSGEGILKYHPQGQ